MNWGTTPTLLYTNFLSLAFVSHHAIQHHSPNVDRPSLNAIPFVPIAPRDESGEVLTDACKRTKLPSPPTGNTNSAMMIVCISAWCFLLFTFIRSFCGEVACQPVVNLHNRGAPSAFSVTSPMLTETFPSVKVQWYHHALLAYRSDSLKGTSKGTGIITIRQLTLGLLRQLPKICTEVAVDNLA